jgi:ketosteroid isomerase-like protein
MKSIVYIFLLTGLSLVQAQNNTEIPEKDINKNIEAWHKAAADADFDTYFGLMTEDSYFLGTDATENWQYEDFKAFSKPYFDKGKAWSFSTLERNIFVGPDTKIAWFDEHLKTQMGICRGSGVIVITDEGWKIKHYVLSIAVPNENVSALTAMKKDWDSLQMKKMLTKIKK